MGRRIPRSQHLQQQQCGWRRRLLQQLLLRPLALPPPVRSRRRLQEEEEEQEEREERERVQEQKVRETYVLKAWRLLRALPEKERSTQVYAAMMEAFACIGRQAESRGLLDLAASHGCVPDTLMFNAALRTCGDEQEVRMVLRLMQDAGVSGDVMTKKLLASVQ